MILKLTERNGHPGYRLIEVTSVTFRRLDEPCVTFRERGSQAEVCVTLKGNAFVLNESGDTIDSFMLNNHRKVGP